MRIYVFLKSIPELAPLTPRQRQSVHGQCFNDCFWFARPTARSVAAYVVFAGVLLASVVAGEVILRRLGIATGYWSRVTCLFIGTPVGSLVVRQIAIPVLRPFYPRYIEREIRYEESLRRLRGSIC